MKKDSIFACLALIIALMFVFGYQAGAQSGRNIRVEVEMNETRSSSAQAGGLWDFRKNKTISNSKQYIVVSDGYSASLRVGKDVPYESFYVQYLFDRGFIATNEVSFREIGTRLWVAPRITGGLIEITLTPEVSYLEDEQTQVVIMEQLTTTVVTGNGQSVRIGGVLEDKEFESYFFKTAEGTDLEIILTPYIE